MMFTKFKLFPYVVVAMGFSIYLVLTGHTILATVFLAFIFAERCLLQLALYLANVMMKKTAQNILDQIKEAEDHASHLLPPFQSEEHSQ